MIDFSFHVGNLDRKMKITCLRAELFSPVNPTIRRFQRKYREIFQILVALSHLGGMIRAPFPQNAG